MPQILMVSSAAVERNAMIGDDGGQPACLSYDTCTALYQATAISAYTCCIQLVQRCMCLHKQCTVVCALQSEMQVGHAYFCHVAEVGLHWYIAVIPGIASIMVLC